jgi:hypothetical protein
MQSRVLDQNHNNGSICNYHLPESFISSHSSQLFSRALWFQPEIPLAQLKKKCGLLTLSNFDTFYEVIKDN